MNVIWSTNYFQKVICSILIATIYINVYIRTINFHPSIFCDNMNDCKTEMFVKLASYLNMLPALSVSAAAQTQISMFRYNFFFKDLIDTGESVI